MRHQRSGEVSLQSIRPGSALYPPLLCLQAELEVEERDLNLGFSVTYKLVKGGKETPGSLVAEKKLSIGLFGTESVGGVSLRLAAYVVPGLLLMMILRLGGFPWLDKLGGTEVATLSLLVSVFLFVVAAYIPHFHFMFAGIGSSVSSSLFSSVAMAIALGLVMVLIHRWLKAHAEGKRQALVAQAADKDTVIFEKALRGAADKFQPITVITRNQEKFVGSLMAPTSSGGIALVGWFALELAADDKRRQQLEPLIAKNQLLQALELASKLGIEPVMRNPVIALRPDGTLAFGGYRQMVPAPTSWKTRPVTSQV